MPSADSLIIFVWCFTIQLHHIHHPAIPSYCSPSLRNLLHAILLLPFPPSCTFISFSYLPPNALPVLPKDCILNFYLTDQSNTSRLPLKKLFAFSLLLYLFPFFFSLFDFLFFLSCLFSIFPINILLFLSPALVSCPPPPGVAMWQGKTGWSRARQVNRLKSAGEAWRIIQCVCTGRWARKCVCVFACSNLALVANHMFPKSLPLLQSSSALSVVTSCHVLISLPYFFLSQTEVLLYSISFTSICVAFQSFASDL